MKTNPEINALKHRIRELEATIAHYKVGEARRIDMLKRIIGIAEEEDYE